MLYGDCSMAGILANTDYQILYRIICDSMPYAQRHTFLALRTKNPDEALHIIEEVWDEVLSHIVQSFLKKEQEVAVNGQTKRSHHERWENEPQ